MQIIKYDIKVSVIVPVYNVSKYLKKCLDSIVNQTLKEIEIIVVNDCSPDPLDDEICREYERLDSRIKYIKHERNKGLSGARNTGILQAKGTFLGFVDSDDYIHKDMYEGMYEQAIKNDCDVMQCSVKVVSDDYIVPNIPVFLEGKEKIIENRKEKISRYFLGSLISHRVCDKIISRKLCLDRAILFPESRIHEDFPYVFKVLFYSERIILFPKIYYYYYSRKGSITTNLHNKWIKASHNMKSLSEIRDFLREKKYHENYKRVYWELYHGIVSPMLYVKSKEDGIRMKKILKEDDFYKNNWRFRIKMRLFILLHTLNIFDLSVKIYFKTFKRIKDKIYKVDY